MYKKFTQFFCTPPGYIHKFLLIMKLSTLLLIVTLVQVSAAGFAQKVTYTQKNATLEQIIKEIRVQTGYNVIVSTDNSKNIQPMDVNFMNTPLTEVLDRILKDQPLNYEIKDKLVIIKEKEPTILDKLKSALTPSSNPGHDIVGRITNFHSEPLAGASVTIKRTRTGAITDANGSFTIRNVNSTDTLVCSFIGYSTKKIPVGDNASFDINLEETTNTLDQVVVQAYGETSQRYSTGDIVTVTAKDIEKQPVQNPLLALQGRVAGLDIQQTSGYASAPVLATIRGRGTIDPNQVTDPLYIVDGVPLTVVNVGGTSNSTSGSSGFIQNGLPNPANGQSPLFSLNPSDIETITVLKDADATSIYGSRAANGVILINTKKGKAGQTQFSVNEQAGFSAVTKYYQMLNTPQYLAMRQEAFRNDGILPDASNAPDLVNWDPNRYTNWQKALWGHLGKTNNTSLSLTGGNEITTFRIAGSYEHSEEITSASGADQRASVSVNLTHHLLHQKMTVSFTTNFSFTQSDMITLPGQVTFAPNAPSIFTANGQLNWADWDAAGLSNPGTGFLQPYTSKANFLTSNLTVSYQFLKGLTISTNFGYNNAQVNQTQLIPIASQDPASNPYGAAYFGNNSNKNWIIEPQLNYAAQLGPGKFTALIGASAQEITTDGTYIQGTGYVSDALLGSVSNAPARDAQDNYGVYRYASVFGRIGYILDDKYILNLNARRDGSSNYGPGNQYGNFASVGGAWIFSQENWFKDHPSFLSYGKLRGSYGLTGSDGGIPYGYITRWSAANLFSYNGIQPLKPTQHANPDYQWQENRQLEIALDMGFFKDWVTANVVYYRKTTGNQLLKYPTPIFSGFGSVVANLPAIVQNAGWEFTIGGKGFHTQYLSWAPAFNFSINQNKFVSYSGIPNPYFQNSLIGHPLNGIYVLHYTGVDPQAGQYTYQDVNHDGVITTKPVSQGGDMYFKKLSPSFQTGFGFNSDFKGLTLSLFFSVKKQIGINALAQGSAPGRFNNNQPVEVLARWQQPGDITNVGKFSTQSNQDPNGYLGQSDIGYTDASYIRLQNASLAYKLPDKTAKKLGMTGCSFFIHANDLFTITGYKGIDPETQSFGGMPPVRTITGGFSLTF